jgi:hypothetical protein
LVPYDAGRRGRLRSQDERIVKTSVTYNGHVVLSGQISGSHSNPILVP